MELDLREKATMPAISFCEPSAETPTPVEGRTDSASVARRDRETRLQVTAAVDFPASDRSFSLAVSTSAKPYAGTHLRWKIDRVSLPFRVRVVEPGSLNPPEHASLLEAVIRDMAGTPSKPKDRYDELAAPSPHAFDLVTFPEAFATTETLLGAAAALAMGGPPCCLHMGLRPDSSSSHLFDFSQTRRLLDGLLSLVDPSLGDLDGFAEWLDRQSPEWYFNVGCVLAIDADGALRTCLHPKLVRSKFETDGLPSHHMHEADLLTLITLMPVRRNFGSVTLQPLICSDALNLQTDRMVPPPVAAISSHADCIDDPPNHVDLVSVATCTPQQSAKRRDGSNYRAWHNRFLEAFRAAAENPECARHHFCVFVLANYTEIDDRLRGGLSGAFLPTPPGPRPLGPGIATSYWGVPKDRSRPNNDWSLPDDDALQCWKMRGFVAGLAPPRAAEVGVARVLDFDIDRLPREISLWQTAAGITSARIRVGAIDGEGTMHLKPWTTTND